MNQLRAYTLANIYSYKQKSMEGLANHIGVPFLSIWNELDENIEVHKYKVAEYLGIKVNTVLKYHKNEGGLLGKFIVFAVKKMFS